jgi:hypothetical protein
MIGKRVSRRARLCAATLAATATVTLIASAATTPRPPAKVCIGTNCVTAPTTSGAIKFHPGSYVWVSATAYAKEQPYVFSLLNSVANDSSVSGVQVVFRWSELEGATAGDYSAGFALVDALLAKMASLPTPKRLMLLVAERTYGTADGNPPVGLLPQYIINMPNGAIVAPKGSHWAGSLVSMARLDNPAVIDRLIALAQAYGNRYNSNPLMEMYAPMGESAVSGSAGLNSSVFIQQMQRLYAGAAQAWPNTALRWELNWVPASDATMASVLEFAKTLPQSVIGGPDSEGPLPVPAGQFGPSSTTQSARVFQGLPSGSGAAAQMFPDQRGQMPWIGEYEAAGNCCGSGGILPAAFAQFQINSLHASYLVYMQNTYLPSGTSSSDPHKWGAQLAYINSTQGATYPGVPAVMAMAAK